jgi:hypothetical protein
MTRICLSSVGLVAALALAGCNPEGDDSGTGCNAVDCAVADCASHGYAGGQCIGGRCYCNGGGSGACDDANCRAACVGVGSTGGSCATSTSCVCTGLPDAGGDDGGTDFTPGSYGFAHGVVMSPGSVFPISGALVYVERTPPSPLTEGNYCPRCLDMSLLPHTFSAADGYFRLENLALGDWYLVVQKGEFRRVRQIRINTHLEELAVPTDYTTLPNAPDPAGGDNIPRIAVALGSYDDMEDILAKVRLADLDGSFHAVLSSAVFDYYDNGGGWGETPFADLLNDPILMAQYQIIFVPCSDSTNDSLLTDSTVQNNVRTWVANGGKWYVADWSYEWVTFMFPDAVNMYGDGGTPGDADITPSYDGPGSVVDTDMAAWLSAMSIDPTSISFLEIWDNICSVGTITATDEEGAPIDVTPKIWAQGQQLANSCGGGEYPYTVTFPYGCGRVLFTTYHTVGAMGEAHPDLLPQEMILLYLVMEIGICTDEVIIW